jgi:HK97 family phage major capsid protein
MKIETRTLSEIRAIVSKETQIRPIIEVRADTINKENRTVEMAFSSEAPYLRWYGFEILSHAPGAVDMSRAKNGLPFCNNHNTNDQRGRILDFRCNDEDKKTRGMVKFSRTQAGEDFWMDFQDGIRKETSIGYYVNDLQEIKQDEMSEELKNMCLENKCGAYIAKNWTPLEGSSAPVPADITVGAGRSAQLEPTNSAAQQGAEQQPTTKKPKEVHMEPVKTAPSAEELKQLETERVTEIEAIGKKYSNRIKGGDTVMQELIKAAIDLKVPSEHFRGDIYTRVSDDLAIETPDTFIDLSEKDKKRYSISRALASLIDPRNFKADFEHECSNFVAEKLGQKPQGIYVPYDIQLSMPNKRDLSVGTTTAGGFLVGTQNLGASFVEILRNESVLISNGAIVMPGLRDSITIPKQTGAATAYWLSTETTDVTESQQVFAQISMSPKTVGAYTDFSRKLLLQSNPVVDTIVTQDLIAVLGLEIDRVGLHGSGASGQPTGIASTSGIGSITDNGANFAWTHVVEFETDVLTANARFNNFVFITTPSIQGLMKQTERFAGTGICLMEDGKANNYPVKATNQVTSGYCFFGPPQTLLLGEWGVLDINVDTAALALSGGVRIIGLKSIDWGVRYPAAWSVATAVS